MGWMGGEDPEDPPLHDTPRVIGLKESPHLIWRRAREEGGIRHAPPPLQQLIGPRSLRVPFGEVGSASRWKAATEDWLLKGLGALSLRDCGCDPGGPARLPAAFRPPRAAKATR